MGVGIRSALLALLVGLGVSACGGPPEAEAARTPLEQLALDSLAADSAALATLPASLQQWMDVREWIAAPAAPALSLHECKELQSPDPELGRRRLRLRLADTAAIVLYTVADRRTGALERVEYVRRGSVSGQRGLVWDRERDRTMSTWWRQTAWGLSRRVERGEIPRGGPAPRALRALGRQLLAIPCEPSAESAAEVMPD